MTPITDLVAELLRTLDDLQIDYAIGGSFASSAWGRPRQTHDVDLAVWLDKEQADSLLRALGDEYLVSPTEIADAIDSTEPFRSFQLLKIDELFKFDIFVLDHSEYATEMMGRRRLNRLAGERETMFSAPEDVVIAKLRWFVLGNRVSDRQWNDIVQVLESQWDSFDFDYARKWARHFEVSEEFERALAQVVL